MIFVQIAVATDKDNREHPFLFALDSNGGVWEYVFNFNIERAGWSKLSTKNLSETIKDFQRR